MRRHRGGYFVAWSVVAGSCLALGAVITVLIDPPAALVLMAIMAAGAASLLAAAVKHPNTSAVRLVLRVAPLLLLVLTGINGLAAALGAATVALVAVLALTGAPLLWQAHHAKDTPAPKPVAPPSEPPKPVVLTPEPVTDRLDDPNPPTTASLCWTWRTSFTALRKADGLDERLRIVELRQHCLDELARREPTGFRKWLDAGARAAGDPSRYVCVRHKTPAREEPHGLDEPSGDG